VNSWLRLAVYEYAGSNPTKCPPGRLRVKVQRRLPWFVDSLTLSPLVAKPSPRRGCPPHHHDLRCYTFQATRLCRHARVLWPVTPLLRRCVQPATALGCRRALVTGALRTLSGPGLPQRGHRALCSTHALASRSTVFAPSTAPGKAAIAVIRITGPLAKVSPFALARAGVQAGKGAELELLLVTLGGGRE
jgi:hypothetical protein